MRNIILDLIQTKPKHYVRLIRANQKMMDWVNQNSMVVSDKLAESIYSAINQVSNICDNGNIKKFDRWSTGFVGCGPANICKCTRDSISANVSSTKTKFSPEKTQKINTKRKVSMLCKYGVEYNSQRQEIKHIWKVPKISEEAHAKLSNKAWLYDEYIEKQRSSVDIARELKIYYSTVASYCIKHGFSIRRRSSYSLTEVEIKEYVESLGIVCESSNWDILGNKELDLYIPSKKIAIEINGLYWHSFNPENFSHEYENKHLDKTINSAEKGVALIHVTDWEWKNKKDIIKSILRSKLGGCDKIYARNTDIRSLTTSEARAFFDDNHLQGYIASSYYVGLYNNDSLVMAISAGANRFQKDGSIELHRLACIKNTTIVGGGSKLLKHLKKITDGKKLVSYCDRSKSTGNGYLKMGFTLERTSGPGYFWTDGNEIISRYQCTKQKLSKWLTTYDSSLSESENMFNAKFRRFWDCGNYVFVW